MTQVNPPPQIRIPRELQGSAEVRNFFESINTVLRQLWVRSGGEVDSLEELLKTVQSILRSLLYSRDTQPEQPDPLQSLFVESDNDSLPTAFITDDNTSLPSAVIKEEQTSSFTINSLDERDVLPQITLPEEEADIVVTAGTITATGEQVIVCENTDILNVRVNPYPNEGERLIIKRRGANVYITSDTNNIDGKFNLSMIDETNTDTLTLLYANNNWSTI